MSTWTGVETKPIQNDAVRFVSPTGTGSCSSSLFFVTRCYTIHTLERASCDSVCWIGMSNLLRSVRVPPNSVSLEEARHRVFDFFRIACRSLPSVMETYNLYDVASVSQLRSTVASEIRKNTHVTDPKVGSPPPYRRISKFNYFLFNFWFNCVV